MDCGGEEASAGLGWRRGLLFPALLMLANAGAYLIKDTPKAADLLTVVRHDPVLLPAELRPWLATDEGPQINYFEACRA